MNYFPMFATLAVCAVCFAVIVLAALKMAGRNDHTKE